MIAEVEISEKLLTVEEYFAFEEHSEERHEFYYSELIAMPGETTTANSIALNLAFFFKMLFKGKPFSFFAHDIKLMVKAEKIYRYPDLVVIHKDGDKKKFVTQPILVVEVLSESTAEVDKEKKKLEYFAISSVQYYLMIHQDEPAVEIYFREGKRWIFDFFTDINDSIELPFFEAKISLKEIYDGISFGE